MAMLTRSGLFVILLLLTSQGPTVRVTAAEEECCPCEDTPSWLAPVAAGLAGVATYFGGSTVAKYLGAEEEGIKKGSLAAEAMRAATLSGLGSNVVSQLQRMGTSSGARKNAYDAAGRTHSMMKDRCCPCHSQL